MPPAEPEPTTLEAVIAQHTARLEKDPALKGELNALLQLEVVRRFGNDLQGAGGDPDDPRGILKEAHAKHQALKMLCDAMGQLLRPAEAEARAAAAEAAEAESDPPKPRKK
jgi:hypothetical protein